MFLKINCLDLQPKPVDDDPLKLKTLLQYKKPEKRFRAVEEKPKKLPMRLESAKTCNRPTNPSNKVFHLSIQKEIQHLEANALSAGKDHLFFKSTIKDKVFVSNENASRNKSAAISRQQSGYRRYKNIFVAPKIKDYNEFRESISKIKVDHNVTSHQESPDTELYNPQFIIREGDKAPRLLSAFTVVKDQPRVNSSIVSRLNQKMRTDKKTLIDLQAINYLMENEMPEVKPRPESCFADLNRRIKGPKMRLLTVKPTSDPKLKDAIRLKSVFSKKIPEMGLNETDVNENCKVYYNKVIKLEISDTSIFKVDFSKIGAPVNLNCGNETLEKYLSYTLQFEELKKYDKALHYLKKIYHCRIFSELGLLRAYTYNHMSFCFFELKDYNSALELNKAFIEVTKGEQRLVGFFNTIVCCRRLLNHSHENFYSELYIQEARKLRSRTHDFFSTVQLILCKLCLGKLAEAKKIADVT